MMQYVARTKTKKTTMKIRLFPFAPIFFKSCFFFSRSLPGHLRILHHSFLAARKSPFCSSRVSTSLPPAHKTNNNYDDEDDNDVVEEEENASQKSPFFAASQDWSLAPAHKTNKALFAPSPIIFLPLFT